MKWENSRKLCDGNESIKGRNKMKGWKEVLTSELMRELAMQTTKEMTNKDLKNIPKWRGDISELSPVKYLRTFNTYLSCLKLNIELHLNLLQEAMIGSAAGWLHTVKRYITS